jgi:cytochrome d ubiquinol oxidase subunit II
MDLYTLQVIWFLLIGVLITGYMILDGFDLGAGIITLFTKEGSDRKLIVNSIGPFWDGNEVWLLAAGGALFAAFPIVYATVFSGFYLAFMLLIFMLIFRAVSIEFRNKGNSVRWQIFWDKVFGISSLIATLLFGIALGNILRGIPLDEKFVFTGSFFGLLNPYSLLVGLLTVALVIMHGAMFLRLRIKGQLQGKFDGIAKLSGYIFLVLFIIASLWVMISLQEISKSGFSRIIFWFVAAIFVLSFIYCQVAGKKRNYRNAFFSSCIMISSLMAISGVSLFPRLVPSLTNTEYSLTISNASSSAPTLLAMFIIALIGMPVVIIYTICIYRIFWTEKVIDNEIY